MGVIVAKNIRYDYGKFIVTGGGAGLTPEDWQEIDQTIQSEVSTQMADHDIKAHDTHNAPSDDQNEYPDVTLFDED